jgi:protein MpaA
MRPRLALTGVLAAALLGAGTLAAAQETPAPAPTTQTPAVPIAKESIGSSVEGRAIRLVRLGDPAAARRVLVVGCVHGDECAARAVVGELLRRRTVPAGVQLLLVRSANPDGQAAHRRQNAHGVDLNRNSSAGWRPLRGAQYSGRRPWSEPESRALRDLVLRERPALVLWYHQPLDLVDRPERGRATVARRYARLTGLPFRPLGAYPGSLSRWVNTRGAGTSFVVELPHGRLSAAATRRHASAVLAVAAVR